MRLLGLLRNRESEEKSNERNKPHALKEIDFNDRRYQQGRQRNSRTEQEEKSRKK